MPTGGWLHWYDKGLKVCQKFLMQGGRYSGTGLCGGMRRR